MWSEEDVQRLLQNLYVLSKVHENERLSTMSGILSIDPIHTFQSFSRYLRGENRSENIRFIKKLIEQSVEILLDSVHTIINEHDPKSEFSLTMKQRQTAILEALQGCKLGINHLFQTYHNDSAIHAALQNILRILDNGLEKVVFVTKTK